MCVMSMILDQYNQDWQKWFLPPPPLPYVPAQPLVTPFNPLVPSPHDMDLFKKMYDAAREYDKANGEPDCELDAKKQQIKDLAAKLGVDVSFIDPPTVETVQQAADAFAIEFANKNLQVVGVSKNVIFIYLKKRVALKKYPKEYHGFAVKINVTGGFVPA